MIAVFLSIAVSAAIGHLLIGPVPGTGVPPGLVRIALGFAIGAGLTSLGCFLAVALFPGATQGWLAADALLLVVATSFALRRRRGPRGSPGTRREGGAGRSSRRTAVVVGVLFALSAAVSLRRFVAEVGSHPGGGFDALVQWDVRARAIAEGGGAFHPYYGATRGLSWEEYPLGQTNDYPLLLPSTLARTRLYSGGNDSRAPAAVSLAFFAAVVLLVVAGTSALHSPSGGALAGALLLAPPFFTLLAASGYADVPLSLYSAGSLLCLLIGSRSRGEPRWFFVSGLLAGLAAWTKNDGVLHLGALAAAATALGFLTGRPARSRDGLVFGAGASAPMLAIALFRWRIAGTRSWLTAGSEADALARLLSPGRWTEIFRRLCETAVDGFRFRPSVGAVFVFAALLAAMTGKPDPRVLKIGAAFLFLAGAGIVFAYLVTPYDLAWQLESSLERVLLQFWPPSVLMLFCAFPSPSRATAAEGASAATI